MNAFVRSRTGWTLVGAYLVFAALLFRQASTCTSFLCDLVALPVALPHGLPVAWLIDWIHWMHPIPAHVPSVHFGHVYFILPTVAANAVLYYLAGHLIEASVRRWRRGRAEPR